MWKGIDVASLRGLIIVSLGLKTVNNNTVSMLFIVRLTQQCDVKLSYIQLV